MIVEDIRRRSIDAAIRFLTRAGNVKAQFAGMIADREVLTVGIQRTEPDRPCRRGTHRWRSRTKPLDCRTRVKTVWFR